MIDSNNFADWFGDVTKMNKVNSKYDDTTMLDDLLEEYNDLVSELKAEGYRVLRNSDGKHKIIKK